MKILVVSDSHGNYRNLLEALEKQIRTCDIVIHLGDGIADLERIKADFPDKMFVSVRGNCDVYPPSSVKREEILNIEGHGILCVHGHDLGVRESTARLENQIIERGLDIGLFGHTHVALERYLPLDGEKRGIWLFNPGSISCPRDGRPSYGLLELRGESVLMSHGRL